MSFSQLLSETNKSGSRNKITIKLVSVVFELTSRICQLEGHSKRSDFGNNVQGGFAYAGV